jgi:hypothetical protein
MALLKRLPAVPLQPVLDPAGWTKDELARSEDWIYALDDLDVEDLDRAVARIEARQLPLIELRRKDFELPILGPTLDRIREELVDGRGLKLIRGVPVHRYTRLQSAIAFLGIGTYIGITASQNAKGHLLGHVKDLGEKSLANPNDRGYQTHDKLPFHSDSCDVVGLLCLHHSKSGGASTVVSTIQIYNEMLKRNPNLVAALAEPIYRDRRGEIPEGAKPYYPLPVFNWHEGYLSVFWQGGYIRSAQRFPELPRHSETLLEALDTFTQLARELCFHMDFRQGDIQFLNNAVTVHSRTEFEDYPEPERKRHLLRLWLATPGGRPLPPAIFERYPNFPRDERPSGGIIVPGTVLKVPLEAE